MYLYLNLYIIYDIINMQRDIIINTFICIGVLYYVNYYLENFLNTNAVELNIQNTSTISDINQQDTELYKCDNLIEDQDQCDDTKQDVEIDQEITQFNEKQDSDGNKYYNQLNKANSSKKQKLLLLKNSLDLIKNQLQHLKNELDGSDINH